MDRREALKSDEGRYRLLVEAITDYAIYMLDPTGLVTSWNPGAERLKGYGAAEILGQHFSKFYTEADRAANLPTWALSEASSKGRFESEGWRVRKDGTRLWAHVVIDAIHGDDGEVIGFAKITRDITERKEAQDALNEARAALLQSQKMDAVGQLTGGIAHDFNNLLAGISGSLELIGQRLAQGRIDAVPRYLNAAQDAAKRAASLTQRLLAFSRRQTLDPKAIDVNRLIGGMEELIRRTTGPSVTVEVVGAAGLWTTFVDPNQLENALLNLCINARDAMPDGGRLTIETANKWLDNRAAQTRDLPPGQYISLCVTDTGTGMSPEIIERVFEPFFTTKPLGQGTGLGLSMVYGFVRQSRGQVRIYSELGHGTTMCLYLPRHFGPETQAEAPPMPSVGHDAEPGEAVLVVDDEPTVRMLVVDVLTEAGYRALEAANGAAGLKILQSDTRVDLLITDVGLPGGMNGRQVADAGRAIRPGLKVLFITGYAENAAVGNGHLDPGMEVITKPFAVDALGAKIRAMIDAPTAVVAPDGVD